MKRDMKLMKRLTRVLFAAACLCLPAALQAQKADDSRYLAGAVPEENGKVVFSKTFGIPGMTQEDVYDRILQWMDTRLKKNANNSRIVYSRKEEGQVAGLGEEWIVFKSTALSLDRTKVQYNLTALCRPGECTLRMERIRFEYREGTDKEKYDAEEWIADKYALNKSKTKLVYGLAKWRRKTVDFADNLFEEAADALNASSAQTSVVQTAATPPSPVGALKDVAPDRLPADLIRMGAGRLVIVIGTDSFNMTTMTANAGGSLGKMSGKPVIFTMLSPDQPYEQLAKADSYTVCFYPNGQNEPSIILECRKLPSQEPLEGQPRTFVGEIVKASVR